MIKKVEGIIIKEIASGDTSKIINILSDSGDIIGIMAKGARNLKSEYRSSTIKMTRCTFNINYKDNKLSTLINADIVDDYKFIKKDLYKISYASYILELTEQVIKHNKDKNVYKLLVDSLDKINNNFDAQVITNILEFKYLEYLGVMPVIDSCAICGNKKIVTISSEKGGYICSNCINNDKIVSEKTLKLIRMFFYVDISKIEKLNIGEDIKKEIDTFINNYYDKYTGLFLKTKIFLKNLNKVS